MATKGQVHWDKWFGGMSDTDTRMSEGQFVYGENIDFRRYPDYIQSAQKPRLAFVTPTLLTSFSRSIKDPAQIFLYGDQGAIFSVSTGESVEQMPGGEDILNAIYFGGRHLWFYQFGQTLNVGCIDDNPPPTTLGSRAGDPSFSRECNLLPIIPLADGSAALTGVGAPVAPGTFEGQLYEDTSTGNVRQWDNTAMVWNQLTNLFTSPPCVPVLNVADNFLYVGVENTIKLLTSQPGGLLVQDIAEFEDKIVGLTNDGNLIKIYLANGRVYYWDGLGFVTQTFQDNDTFVRYVNNFGAYDYIVSSQVAFSELYINQGLQFQLLKQGHSTEGGENSSKFRYTIENACATGSMTKYQNVIYTAVQQGVTLGSNLAIASRGNTYNGYPIAHSVDSTLNSNGDAYDNIGVMVDGLGVFPELIYSREANGGFGVDFINLGIDPLPEIYQDEGVIYSPKYVLDHVETKRVYELDIRYANTDPGKTIRIDYALDGGVYQNLVIIDEDTDVERKESKFRKFGMNLLLNELIDDDFFEIQFKVTMSTDDNAISPRLYSLRFKYELIET